VILLAFLSELQQEQPQDPEYPLIAFCLSIQDACGDWATQSDSNLAAFGYGNPTHDPENPLGFMEECVEVIAESGMASDGSPLFEVDSFVCRAYHLGMAFISPDIHCPHSALHSTVCTGTQTYSCGG